MSGACRIPSGLHTAEAQPRTLLLDAAIRTPADTILSPSFLTSAAVPCFGINTERKYLSCNATH